MEVCDVPGVQTVCDTVGDAAAAAAAAPFQWLAGALAETAAWMTEQLWAAIDTTTRVELTGPAYIGVYNVVFGIAVGLMLLLFFAQLIGGMLRRDPTALSTATVGLGKAMVGSFVVVSVTGTLLEITDQLAIGIVAASGTTMAQMGERMALLFAGFATLSTAAPGVGVIMTSFLSGLAIAAAFLVWTSLLVRKAILLVAIVLAPVALSGLVWRATRDWVRRWAALVAALIVSKLIVVVVLLVATAQVSSPVGADLASVSDPIAGIVLLMVAAFAPYMAYKLISFAGVDVAQASGAERDVKQAMAPRAVTRLPGTAARVLGPTGRPTPGATGGGGGAAGGGAGAAGGGGGGAAGAGAAGGALAVVAAAAKAGPRMGKTVAGTTSGHLDTAQQHGAAAPHPPVPPTDRAPAPTPTPRSPGAGERA